MAHDFYMTMAQLIPVIGLGYGIEVNSSAKTASEGAVPPTLRWIQAIVFVYTGGGLVYGWIVSLLALWRPDRWMDGSAQSWVLGFVISAGVIVLLTPILNFILDAWFSRRKKA